MENNPLLIQQVLDALKSYSSSGKSALVGLDGYVDKIQHPVQFQSKDGNVYFPTLSEFGQKIISASNQSAQIELYTQEIKLGGNAPNMAHALASLEIPNLCLGTLGYPTIDPIFNTIHKGSELISVGAAAETNALEFDDGKLILSEISTFNELDWETVMGKINLQHLRDKARKASLIALVDWCNLPFATSIWQGVLDDVIKVGNLVGLQFFFDLADPSKKGKEEVQTVLELLGKYRSCGFVTMGLNENETHKLFSLLNSETNEMDLVQKGQYIFDRLDIDRLVVHPVNSCFVFEADHNFSLLGRVVQKPKVTTGGGDNFNAGFSFGTLNGFPTEQCMVLAMATSGSYVENGKSPEIKDLIDYLTNWLKELTR